MTQRISLSPAKQAAFAFSFVGLGGLTRPA
jgi:hypothetical protein